MVFVNASMRTSDMSVAHLASDHDNLVDKDRRFNLTSHDLKIASLSSEEEEERECPKQNMSM